MVRDYWFNNCLNDTIYSFFYNLRASHLFLTTVLTCFSCARMVAPYWSSDSIKFTYAFSNIKKSPEQFKLRANEIVYQNMAANSKSFTSNLPFSDWCYQFCFWARDVFENVSFYGHNFFIMSSLNKEHSRLKFCFQLSKCATKTHKMLKAAYEEHIINRERYFEWYAHLKNDHESIEGDSRSRRPSTSTGGNHVYQVSKVVDMNPQLTAEKYSIFIGS